MSLLLCKDYFIKMKFDIFKSADKLFLDWIKHNALEIDIPKDNYLIIESKEISSIFVLIEGTLEVLTSSSKSSNLSLDILNAGSMIGEMSFLEGDLPVASVKSNTQCKLFNIKFKLLTDEIIRNPRLAKSFYKLIAQKLCAQLISQNKLISYVHSKYDDNNEPLRKFIPLFSSLTDIDAAWISNNGKLLSIENREVLINQGETLKYIYIVLSGSGDIYLNEGGRKLKVGISKRGELLGETSMMLDKQECASASVIASPQMDLLAISRSILNDKINSDLAFGFRFYRGLAIMLSQRSRDQLDRAGLNYHSKSSNQKDNYTYDNDELDLKTLTSISKASNSFDRLCNKLYNT